MPRRILALSFVLLALASPSLGDTDTPATQPATKPVAATVSTKAQPVLDAIDKAYLALKGLDLAGSFALDADVSGQTHNRRIDFTARYAAPALFRHTAQGDAVVGATGQRVFAYLPHRNAYVARDTKPARLDVAAMPEAVRSVLSAQNPSLLMAAAQKPSAALSHGYASVEKLADTEIKGTKYLTLQLSSESEVAIALFDPATHLLRRFTSDLRPMLTQRGADAVKKALYVVDYTTVTPDGPVAAADTFAWSPPDGARDVSKGLREHDSPGDADDATAALVDKPAPDFTLPTLTDDPVKLAAIKDRVVVLDFWASWCGPCMVSLPHLNTFHEKLAADEAKVTLIAINVGEQKDHVTRIVTDKKWTFTVALDEDNAVSESYGITGLPTTIIIDRTGTVKKAFVGAGRHAEIEKAVEELAK
jgi:thiol-disulfide isomerase/thioredoxin